jgi:hypothetical protein
MKGRWRLELAQGQQYVDADEVEITPSGALVFFRSAGRTESQRTLLSAWAPSTWRRCEVEGSG